MAYYRVCRFCGSNLDPGERCDCMDKRQEREDLFERITTESETGQMVLRFRPVARGIRGSR